MPARNSRAEVLDREANALELRRNGASYPEIAQRLSISVSGAAKAVKRGLDRHISEAAPDVRKLELDRLDQMQVAALAVLRRDRVVIHNGKVVYVCDEDGQEIPLRERDDSLALQAIGTLLSIQARRARLLGLDAPTKVDVKVFTVDEMDARIAELESQLADNDRNPQPSGG